MGISLNLLLAVCGGASAIATGIFWMAYYLGKYIGQFEMVKDTVEEHSQILAVFKRAGSGA